MSHPGQSVLERDTDAYLVNAPWQHSARGDSEAERCAALFRAALAEHFRAALVERIAEGSAITEEERDQSRRILLSPLSPWREDREFLSIAAGFEPDAVRARAVALLAPLLAKARAAEEKRRETAAECRARLALLRHVECGGDSAAKGSLRSKPIAAKAARPVPMTSADLLDYIEANEGGLSELGELDAALAYAVEIEAAELQKEERAHYMRRWKSARREQVEHAAA